MHNDLVPFSLRLCGITNYVVYVCHWTVIKIGSFVELSNREFRKRRLMVEIISCLSIFIVLTSTAWLDFNFTFTRYNLFFKNRKSIITSFCHSNFTGFRNYIKSCLKSWWCNSSYGTRYINHNTIDLNNFNILTNFPLAF